MLSLRNNISLLARSVNTAATRKQVEEVYVVSSARTPLGSMGGKLKVKAALRNKYPPQWDNYRNSEQWSWAVPLSGLAWMLPMLIQVLLRRYLWDASSR